MSTPFNPEWLKPGAAVEVSINNLAAYHAEVQRLMEENAALRAALAEPVQEPVAWLFTNLQSGDYDFCYQEDEHDHDREMWHKQPLYTAPPQRKPLTEEEIDKIVAAHVRITDQNLSGAVYMAMRDLEAAHGIGEKE